MENLKRNGLTGISLRIASLCIFLAMWQVCAFYVNNESFPPPNEVGINLIYNISKGDLLFQLGVTLLRVLASFIIAMGIGVALGLIMGRYKRWNAALDGALLLALNLPALVVIILCYIWFGLGEFAAVLAVSIEVKQGIFLYTAARLI